jgi:hypothetical protein
MKTASFFPKNIVFRPDDAAPIPIHKVNSLMSDHDDDHRLRAVVVKTFSATINNSCKVGTSGRLTVDVPAIFRADGRWADQSWIGHDFGRLVLVSNHPSCVEGEFPYVTLVFRPADQ